MTIQEFRFARWFLIMLLAIFPWIEGCDSGVSTFAATQRCAQNEFDVVVYGGTAAGAIAAVSAANEGLNVALVEPGLHLGGMVSGGLGRTDYGTSSVIGGRAREFFERVGEAYGLKVAWHFEPHVAETVFDDWAKESGVQVFLGENLTAVERSPTSIRSLETESGRVFSGCVFIDASYEGDLMAQSGVSYTWGREGHAVYGESFAGRLGVNSIHQFKSELSAYDDSGKLFPLIFPDEPNLVGEGDKKIQAYNFRLCLTTDKGNQIPFPKPPGYAPEEFALLSRYLSQEGMGFHINNLMYPGPLPNDKADVNNAGPVSTDYIGGNWDYPEADFRRREVIKEEHKHYTQGLLYFLANDPSVPALLQSSMQKWGLAKDEFVDNDNWPYQLYVREARRMVGEYVMTQADLETALTKSDSIGMGSYPMDSHHVQRVVTAEGNVLNEGSFSMGVSPYEIPYRSLLPKMSEIDNLVVPVCVSASHVAFGSLRMEPQFMIMGHAAGQAAFLALRDNLPLGQINIAELQSRLRAQGQVLTQADFPTGNTLPTGSIVINDGAMTTSSTKVQLTLSASDSDGVTHMQFSKDGGTIWHAWEPYATTREVTLSPPGPGLKTIDVRFKDTENAVSAACSASILFQPSVELQNLSAIADPSLSGTIKFNSDSGIATTNRVALSLSASSTRGIPITRMQFSKDGGTTWYPWEPYATTRSVTLSSPGPGNKMIDVRFMDSEGNVSAGYRATILLE